ncbi:MAG TPA: FAD:protein FMN transferase [Thermodesulfobacteriota bacterium]|nr:FAD:protein FMN transferase [Thermodesulfobacteriota bacterium]
MSLILPLLFSITLTPKPVLVERAFFVMGTVIEFRLYCQTKELCNEAIFDAYSEVKRLDDMLSNYKTDSNLSLVNSQAGKGRIKVPPEFVELTERAVYFSNLTDGAFDITVGDLVDLWRNSQQKDDMPDEKTIKRTVSECVGSKKIALYPREKEIQLKSSCLSIDFGGIGKGYAVDRALKILKANGIESGVINFSGNIYAIGSPPGEEGWTIAIRHPRMKEEALTFIKVRDMAVSTSGDYERYFEINGKRFSHIIDPRTGYPVESVPSVTIIAENATDADALSTAVSVMGKEKSVETLEKLERVGSIIVTGHKGNLSIYKDSFFKGFEIPESGSLQ